MNHDNSGQWDVYIAMYENEIPGSTTLRMDLIETAPIKEFPLLLRVFYFYDLKREDGFPVSAEMELIQKISLDLEQHLISKKLSHIYAGTLTTNGERVEYYYINDKNLFEKSVREFFKDKYPERDFEVIVSKDRKWNGYRKFLYPNEETQQYMLDEKTIYHLESKGDNGQKPRRIDHWLYFNSEKRMLKCKKVLVESGFQFDSTSKLEGTEMPYQLQVWVESPVNIDEIFPVTSMLRKVAKKYKGDYDGWETKIQ